ncbi:POTRA domain-containing protein [Segetibacter sp. 3557_3]|uniref:POTRA domain-containing protein n=1 Tax=Segetibacter sp. 3557_3 TaxID=2547429 RepID=UPI0014045A8D|nr:POTRA domain-containing protein [Segetibacter sp. 3557_3]
MAKLPGYRVWVFGLLLIWVLVPRPSFSQGSHRMVYHFIDGDSARISNELKLKTSFGNKVESTAFISRLPAILQAGGYLAGSVDSSSVNDSISYVSVYTGAHFGNRAIGIKEVDRTLLDDAGYKIANNQPLNFSQYRELQQKLLSHLENNGYPFARLMLDSISLRPGQVSAFVLLDKGIPYRFDSVRIFGSAKISKNFIHRYLAIERGSIYRREKLEKVNQRLLELPYLEQEQPWDLTMLSTGSILNLYLKPRKSNQVDVIAGFFPANQQTGGKLLFTVDANLQLQNAFGGGENIGVVWQQIQPKSPRLNLQYQQPYLFNSPFGIDFSFDLYKRDSAYLNISTEAGLMYSLASGQTGKLVIQNNRTNILEVDTARIKAFKTLPDVVDVSSVSLGVEYTYTNTDYRFNPRRGNELELFASAGNKKIRRNNTVLQIKDTAYNYGRLYDTLKLNAYQVRLRLRGAHYFPIGKQAVIKTGLNAGWFESPNYFRNELFQIGGYRLLRGFDEESIFTSRYAVGTFEYRYLLGLNSYFFGFSDFGWSQNKSIKNARGNRYVGGGVGLAVETKGGIFNLSIAAGKRNDLDFSLRQSKIHLGYVSIF